MLVTNREDLTADWLVLELSERGVDFVRFNTEDYPTRATLRWTPAGADLRAEVAVIDASEVSAVWWRRPVPPQLSDDRPPRERAWAAAEAQAAMDGFLRTMPARWVNHPLANLAAECKPEQLVRARRLGFDIPPTLVTNAPVELREFTTQHGQIVCKALLDARVPLDTAEEGADEAIVYTTVLDPVGLGDLDDFGPEPYLFQALVPKRYDLRVTVIGEQVFACRIESQEDDDARVDWRRGELHDLAHRVEALPEHVAAACLALTHDYNLRFAAIDLARRPDGGYTFFELNPNGQWAWVEQLTGLPLRAALVEELVRSP